MDELVHKRNELTSTIRKEKKKHYEQENDRYKHNSEKCGKPLNNCFVERKQMTVLDMFTISLIVLPLHQYERITLPKL